MSQDIFHSEGRSYINSTHMIHVRFGSPAVKWHYSTSSLHGWALHVISLYLYITSTENPALSCFQLLTHFIPTFFVEKLKETKKDIRITGLLFEIQTRNLSSKEEQRQPINSDNPQTFYSYFLISPSGIICADICICTLTAGSTNIPCSIVYRVKLTAAPITIHPVPAHLCCLDPSKKFVQIRDLA
jgi:hypothetical protein